MPTTSDRFGADLVGSEWVSKDGKRGLVVLDEGEPFCSERQFLVKGTSGSTRQRWIGYRGLHAKYRRVDTPAPTTAELQARVAELEAFVSDLAGHGLRADLNPTVIDSGRGEGVIQLTRYLYRIDESIRGRAAALLPED